MHAERAAVAARPLHHLAWISAAAVSYWSCQYAVAGPSPIDRALPWVAVIITFVAWLVRDTPVFPAVQCAVPALIAAAIAFPAERERLLAYGAIAAAAFAGALLARGAFGLPAPQAAGAYAGFTLAGVGLLRWMGRQDSEPGRELLIAAGAVLITLAFGRARSALTVAFAIAVALLTPAIPSRTIALPFLVAAVVALVGRALKPRLDRVVSGLERRRAERSPWWSSATRFHPRAEDRRSAGEWPAAYTDLLGVVPAAMMVAVFAWSGVAARALPYFWSSRPVVEERPLSFALRPGQSVTLEVPSGARGLIVSLANGVRLRPGKIVGRIEPEGRVIRIGEVADWGFARRRQVWRSRNVLPRIPAGSIHGYGYDAWVGGAGWIPIRPVERLTVTADPALQADVRLQVEAFGVEKR